MGNDHFNVHINSEDRLRNVSKHCPVTGLRRTMLPEWTNVKLSENYHVDFEVIGDFILLSRGYGHANLPGMEKAYTLHKKIVAEFFGEERSYIVLEDLSNVLDATKDSRAYYTNYIEQVPQMQAVVFYGVSRIFYVSINLAKKIHLLKTSVNVAMNYQEAVKKAIALRQLSQGQLPANIKSSQGDVVRQCEVSGLPIRHNPEWEGQIAGYTVKFGILGTHILLSEASGYLTKEALDFGMPYARRVLAEVGNGVEPYVRLQDISEITHVEPEARRDFIELLKSRDRMIAYIYYNAPKLQKTSIRIAKAFGVLPGKIHMVNSYEEAVRLALRFLKKDEVERFIPESDSQIDQIVAQGRCPISKLPVVQRPQWRNIIIEEATGYSGSCCMIGDQIYLSKVQGTPTVQGLQTGLEHQEHMMDELGLVQKPHIIIEDVSNARSFSSAHRKMYLSYLSRRKSTLAVLFMGGGAGIRFSIFLTKKMNLCSVAIQAVSDYEEAIIMAQKILKQNDELITTKKLLLQKPVEYRFNTGSASVLLQVIHSSLLVIQPTGALTMEIINQMYQTEIAFAKQHLRKDGPIYVMFDLKNLPDLEADVRREGIRKVNKLHAMFNFKQVFLAYPTGGMSTYLLFIRPFVRMPVKMVNSISEAIDSVQTKESALKKQSKRLQKKDQYSRYADELLSFIGDINWEVAGEVSRPLMVDESHPFADVFDALGLIKQDLDEVFRVRKEMELQLKDLAVKAEEASVAKSEFLANMSHEIRTPMNGVIGMTSLLLHTQLNAKQKLYTETVKSSADHLMAVINDILDFSKIEAGKLELEKTDFSLAKLLKEVSDLMAFRASAKGIEFVFHANDDLPYLLAGDVVRLRQVLVNLSDNAIKFTSEGEILLVVIPLEKNENTITIRFEVSDSGIGIPSDRIGKLFKAFTQADGSITRRFGGTGLGLAISHRIIGVMGGELKVQSIENTGSTFFFELTFPCTYMEKPARNNVAIANKKMLLVEDHPTVAAHASRIFHELQLECMTVDSPKDALIALDACQNTNQAYELVVIDQTLAQIDGIQLAHQIRERPYGKSLPLIHFTFPNLSPDDIKETPFDYFLAKPLMIESAETFFAQVYQSDAQQEPAPSAPQSMVKIQNHKEHILLVEDNATNIVVGMSILKELGYRCTAVSNGKEALEALEQNRFHLVFMDCHMPVMDGFEATRIIKSTPQYAHLPIIAMTANATKEDKDQCLVSGMDAFISKPVSAEKVADILQIYLHGARAQAANEHFDEESLLQRTAGNEQVIQKLIKKFLQNMPSQLSALKHSLQNDPKPSNWEALCHACKGPVMNVGAVKMNRLLDSLLLNIPALNNEQLLQQYGKINEAYEQLVHEFKAMGYLES